MPAGFGAKLTVVFVVPWPLAHLIVLTVLPFSAPVPALVVPVPLPPVALVGKHFETVMFTLLPTVFATTALQLAGCVAAGAGMASGTATNDADVAAMATARARIVTFMHFPLCRNLKYQTYCHRGALDPRVQHVVLWSHASRTPPNSQASSSRGSERRHPRCGRLRRRR